MHNIIVALIIYTSTLFSPTFSFAQIDNVKTTGTDTLLNIAKEFLSAKEMSYQAKAAKEDIEKILNFCTDSIQYDHVLSEGMTFSFTGKDQWRIGSLSHLGETKNARINIVKHIERQNIVILEFDLYREIKMNEAWKKDLKRTCVSILEFDNKKRIKKITDYL